MPQVQYRYQPVGNVEVFYREAGPPGAPVILLLHGFPTSGHMFRDLIPELSDRYHVIAPALPGFGQTKAPPRAAFDYSFDNLADVIAGFVEAIGLARYALYIFDYGAPTGLRLAMRHPQRVSAIITQNGNAYARGRARTRDDAVANLLARADTGTPRGDAPFALGRGNPVSISAWRPSRPGFA